MSARDLAKIVLADVAQLADEQTAVLIDVGAHPDNGTIETQRGKVLGIRLAIERMKRIFKEEIVNG